MAEIREVQSNRQSCFRRHAPGLLDLLVREPLAQLAGSPSGAFRSDESLRFHMAKYTRVSRTKNRDIPNFLFSHVGSLDSTRGMLTGCLF